MTAFTYVVLLLIPGLVLASSILAEFTLLKSILLAFLLSVSLFAIASRVKNRKEASWKPTVSKWGLCLRSLLIQNCVYDALSAVFPFALDIRAKSRRLVCCSWWRQISETNDLKLSRMDTESQCQFCGGKATVAIAKDGEHSIFLCEKHIVYLAKVLVDNVLSGDCIPPPCYRWSAVIMKKHNWQV